ncbi:MAG: DUF3140 domain-containing protein [Pseudonocardia sp.]|uniref:DUF3140 domain-containing protein n=1 Tax=unclassified Pseudonocardia TaxID=2619320 RepID=UPI00086CC266|nr:MULTISPECIES: DUF3140 domain-containing protein [unclassified Pseudonocardia]MBN9107266.1 DUF3140 domain-containing protein [Pseudonocardia sp.]ODU27008.1 MAG: hypothetical protein ABS80_05375 [Pseudonocardia sp. SCN 72-51]ODV06523.1 MAG: hypothetical protein ABT15_11860 [Pseudonocardia sp. SCN 73-27]
MAEKEDTRAEFDEAVNMSAGDLEKWLVTAESEDAGQSDGDVRDTRWRYSLMNWGHDPLR